MAHDVFISHSVKDKATADAVCAMLESNGIRCWIAPRDVLPSMEWGEAIIDAIEQCRVMVLVFTANANTSPQIRREVERAVHRGVAILPLRIEDVLPGKALEYFIGNVHWLDALTPPFEAHLKNLAGTIKIVLARMEPREASPAQPAVAREAPRVARPPEPTVEPSAKPAVAPSVPQWEEPYSNGGQSRREVTLEKGGAREKAPAPRGFWNARSWTWAAGTATALLLAAVFIGMHLNSHPAPVPSPGPIASTPQNVPGTAAPSGATPVTPAPSPLPAQEAPPAASKTPKPAANAPGAPADNAALLRGTMSTIQKELSSIGTVHFTANTKMRTDSAAFQYDYIEQVSNVVADPAQCRVSYHRKLLRDGEAVTDDSDWFWLPSVTSVVVEPTGEGILEGAVAEGGTTTIVTSTSPPATAVVVRFRDREDSFGVGLLFLDAALANRTAATITQAVKLCGGHVAN